MRKGWKLVQNLVGDGHVAVHDSGDVILQRDEKAFVVGWNTQEILGIQRNTTIETGVWTVERLSTEESDRVIFTFKGAPHQITLGVPEKFEIRWADFAKVAK